MELYIDGVLCAFRKYTGDYIPASDLSIHKWDHLRIGYAGMGVGSVKMDVDEVAIYNRVLSADEVKNHFYLLLP